MKIKERNSEKVKTPLKEKILITIFSVIIAASLLFVAGVFILNTTFLKEKSNGDGNGLLDTDIATPAEIKEKCVNFLVVGIANYDGDTGYRGKLTDVIMLVSFDIKGKTVNILQIPRDTYVGNDAPSTGKINEVYGKKTSGGIEGLASVVSKTLNLTIDHYVTLNMSGFIKIIDKLGGVELDVPKKIELEGIVIKQGLQTLDGFTAEKFVRERHSYANEDIGRLGAQQLFMKALIEQVFDMGYSEMAGLVPTMFSDVTTDLTINQALGFYKSLMKVDRSAGINFHMIPFAAARGGSVISIKKQHTADLLNQYFRPYTPDVTADDLYGVIELVTDYQYP